MAASYCCGFVAGTNKHQLWCSQHPDRIKERIVEKTDAKPPSNSEQGIVDDEAKAVIQAIKTDPLHKWTSDDKWFNRETGLSVLVEKGPSGLQVKTPGAGSLYNLRNGYDTSASQQAIWDAYRDWQKRRLHDQIKPIPLPEYVPTRPRDIRWLFVAALGVLWTPFALWIGVVWWTARPSAPNGEMLPGLSPMEAGWNVVETLLNFLWFPAGVGIGIVAIIAGLACYSDRERWFFR